VIRLEYVLTHSLVVRFSVLFFSNSDSEEREDEGGQEEEDQGGLPAGQWGGRSHVAWVSGFAAGSLGGMYLY
jgi:hypothetical protein